MCCGGKWIATVTNTRLQGHDRIEDKDQTLVTETTGFFFWRSFLKWSLKVVVVDDDDDTKALLNWFYPRNSSIPFLLDGIPFSLDDIPLSSFLQDPFDNAAMATLKCKIPDEDLDIITIKTLLKKSQLRKVGAPHHLNRNPATRQYRYVDHIVNLRVQVMAESPVPGDTVVFLALSDRGDFSRLKVIRDGYLPETDLFCAEYPILARQPFRQVYATLVDFENGQQGESYEPPRRATRRRTALILQV